MTDLLLEHVQPGMVLDHHVTDRKGNVLLRKGVAITERHLTLLRAQGIARIAASLPGKESTKETTMSAEEASLLVDRQFRNTDASHPLIHELMRVCRQRRQQDPLGGREDD